jgi:hypothetical protein
MPHFHAIQCSKQLATHVLVGMGSASFWRGAWYVLDDHLFPDNAEHSAAASLGLGILGMAASQGLVARAERLAEHITKRPCRSLTLARCGALYTVALSCVLVWRGTWIGWDCLYERLHPHVMRMGPSSEHPLHTTTDNPTTDAPPRVSATDRHHATHSGLLSHVTALTLLLGTGLFASVLAPPAAISVLRDGAIRGVAATATSSKAYQPPAQRLVNSWLSQRSLSTRLPKK